MSFFPFHSGWGMYTDMDIMTITQDTGAMVMEETGGMTEIKDIMNRVYIQIS